MHQIAIFIGAKSNFSGGACPQTLLHELWKSYRPPISNPESAPWLLHAPYSSYKILVKLKIHNFSCKNAINRTKI